MMDREFKKRLIAATPRDAQIYGFSLHKDSIFFIQDFSQADFVHDAVSGERFHFPGTSLSDQVCIAGDFNEWQQIEMMRAPRVSNLFGISLPFSMFPKLPYEFKFVANRNLWIEPPDFATNVIDAAVGDPTSRNLVLFTSRK